MKQVKYMHFHSSCSFAALAFILAEKGIMTEDTEIVMEAGLPWIFAREGDSFLAGPMLQGKKWYDLYLKPRGLCMLEEPVERERLPEYLRDHEGCMLSRHSGMPRLDLSDIYLCRPYAVITPAEKRGAAFGRAPSKYFAPLGKGNGVIRFMVSLFPLVPFSYYTRRYRD